MVGNGWVFSTVIFLVDVFPIALLLITLPSLAVSFEGLAVFVVKTADLGITLAPVDATSRLTLIMYSLTLLIEFQAYALVLFGAYLLGRSWFRPATADARRAARETCAVSVGWPGSASRPSRWSSSARRTRPSRSTSSCRWCPPRDPCPTSAGPIVAVGGGEPWRRVTFRWKAPCEHGRPSWRSAGQLDGESSGMTDHRASSVTCAASVGSPGREARRAPSVRCRTDAARPAPAVLPPGRAWGTCRCVASDAGRVVVEQRECLSVGRSRRRRRRAAGLSSRASRAQSPGQLGADRAEDVGVRGHSVRGPGRAGRVRRHRHGVHVGRT